MLLLVFKLMSVSELSTLCMGILNWVALRQPSGHLVGKSYSLALTVCSLCIMFICCFSDARIEFG